MKRTGHRSYLDIDLMRSAIMSSVLPTGADFAERMARENADPARRRVARRK